MPQLWLPLRVTPNLPRASPPRGIDPLQRLSYAEIMNATPEDFSSNLLAPGPAGAFPFLLIIGPFAASSAMLTFAARLALLTPLRVLDGGNRFNAREVARILRGLNAPDLYAALGRIRLARAFTCYQMLALLEETLPSSHPTLILDLLDTFYDESAPLDERRRLIENCLLQLRSLSLLAPVVASVRPPAPTHSDPTGLLEMVQQAADSLWFQEDLPEMKKAKRSSPLSQPGLF